MKKAPLIFGIIMTVFLGACILFRVVGFSKLGIEDAPIFVVGNTTASRSGKKNSEPLHTISANNINVKRQTGIENPEKDSALKFEANLLEEDWKKRMEAGLTERNINSVYNKCGDLFAFHSLNESEKQLYAEIYLILTNHATEVMVCSVDEKSIDYAYNCVLNDHPEIFYVDGYNYTRYSAGETVQKISFGGREILSSGEIDRYEKEIMVYENEFLAGISKTASDYEKVKYTYEYIIQKTEYDNSAPLNQTICSVMVSHRSVCQGYAKSVQYLLEKLGVKSTLVVGRTRNGENHSWNLVNVEGAYYYVDATWGDYSYDGNQFSRNKPGGITYDYLCITTEELLKTHVIENVVPVPACISTDANYFVKEGRYFEYMDEEKLLNAFQNALSSGENFVSIKCSSDEVFQYMFQTLLTNQDIFRFVPGDVDSLNYTYNEQLYSMTFFF